MTEEQYKKEKSLLKSRVTSIKTAIKNKQEGPKTAQKLEKAEKEYQKFCLEWTNKIKTENIKPVVTKLFVLEDCFNFDKIFFTEEIAKRYKKKIQTSKTRGIEFSLSLETFTILLNQTECYYTGIKYQSLSEISIDRVDNDKGYVEGNCISCLGQINGLKADFKVIELQAMYERLVSKQAMKFKPTMPNETLKQIYLATKQFVNRKPLEEFNPFK